MEPTEFAIAVVGMVFVIILMTAIFRFAKNEEERKAGVRLEKAREETHQAIAQHVASGALKVEDAERLLRAMGDADKRLQDVQGDLEDAMHDVAQPALQA